jgi:uncharacterized RDD family membrane protein YckC/type II secretory pathway pseudopilin PulG
MYCANCGKELSQDAKFCQFCGASKDGTTAQTFATAVSAPVRQYGVASIGTRFINFILDRIFGYIFVIIVVALFAAMFAFDTENNPGRTFILGLFALIGYYVLFEGVWQKTLGKFITSTKVVKQDGTKPDFGQILGRTLARFIPFEALSFLFTPIGWHDSLSKTLVVPASYTADDVKKIDLKNPSLKSGTNTALIVAIVIFVGIAIMGLLSTLAVVALNSARQRSRDAKRVADIRQIQTALELGYSETASYPTAFIPALGDGNAVVLCKNHGVATFQSTTFGCDPVYMGLVPSNSAPGGENYTYTGYGSSYQLTFSLEGATGQLNAGPNCANSNGIQAGSSC